MLPALRWLQSAQRTAACGVMGESKNFVRISTAEVARVLECHFTRVGYELIVQPAARLKQRDVLRVQLDVGDGGDDGSWRHRSQPAHSQRRQLRVGLYKIIHSHVTCGQVGRGGGGVL